MARFSRALLFGFLISAAVLVCVVNIMERVRYEAEVTRVAAFLPSRLIDREAFRPSLARHKTLFWLGLDKGVSMDLLASRQAFESVFPGYEDTRSDAHFWREYMGRDFMGGVYSPMLSSRESFSVAVSWQGGIELFRRFGGDVVIFGSSETQALIPARLQRRLDAALRGDGKGTKILELAVGSMNLDAILLSAQRMADTGRRARLAILGYSVWYAGRTQATQAMQRGRRKLHDRAHSIVGVTARLTGFTRKPQWDHLFPVTSGEDDPAELIGHKADRLFRKNMLEDPEALAARARGMRPYFNLMEGLDEKACGMSVASAELDESLAALFRLADEVVIYVPPTTPLQTDYAPACFVPAIKSMLRGKAGKRVQVVIDDWRTYGLDWADYVKPASRPGWAVIDANHVNYFGGVKVTDFLGDRVAPRWVRR